MNDYIATDGDGNIVGKYRVSQPPNLPDGVETEKVRDVDDYTVDYWWDEQSEAR